MATGALRAAVYVRISEDDGSALGVRRQTDDCEALAKAKGWDVVEIFNDNDVSASKKKPRPAYERLLQAVRSGHINAIVVWDVDRLTRTPRELEDVITFADCFDLRLASVGGDIDLATEQGRLTARLKGSVARYEVEQASRRLKRKHDEIAAAGRPNGPQAFGYDRVRVELEDGRSIARDVVNPAEAAIVHEAADRILRGESLWRVVNDLNHRGLVTKTGGPWQTQTLRRVLLRTRNIGMRSHRGVVVGDADWPPILEVATFERLVATLTDPRRRTSNRGTAVKYLLSSRALCGVCGQRMVGTAGFVYTYRTYPKSYACNNSGCHKVTRRMEDVDRLVEGVVVGVLERDGVRILGGDPAACEAAQARMESIRAKMAVAADQFAADAITGEQLARITAHLRPQLESAQAEAGRAAPQGDLADFAGLGAAAAWDQAGVETKRMVMQQLGVTISILPVGAGRTPGPEHIRIEWSQRDERE
ncbi:recombinase family protein [Allobranchiibius sp. GilTou38]|uniref:recombinase family protein n=1 Tax=Allobranchiibius sp. GilTou38 TaxID=2815210 RepID=UPI001AA1237C|nr:recombinase family protein [Allobranchiibius sp. GilTou38]